MKDREDIDHILKHWPFDPTSVTVRKIWVDSRDVLQLRLDMGILQMETVHRPDGKRPHGAKTYFDYLRKQIRKKKKEFELSEEQCAEIDREFVQYYHRRVCWLHLHEFENAVMDADHTLQLMDLCREHSKDEDWTVSHEQYRPFVLYHRTQAAALAIIEADGLNAGEFAIDQVNIGLAKIQHLFVEYDATEQFSEDDLVLQLIDFRENLRRRFEIDKTLEERLAEAVKNEDYELAASLRDELSRRETKPDTNVP